MNYELIEDVLDKEIYEEINKKFNSSFFPWFYNDSTIPGADNNFMFTHHLYNKYHYFHLLINTKNYY